MSGKKATEVNGLLARGKNARESGLGNYLSNLNLAKKILRKNQEEIGEIHDRIDSQTIEIKAESKAEFPAESKQLQEQFDGIKRANVIVDYSKDIKNADVEEKEIDSELLNADQEQDRIRNRIKNKDWYCDEEYKDAGKLVKVYQKIAEKKNQLVAAITKKAQKSNQTVVKYQNLEKQMDQVVAAGKELNDKATRIVELREKAVDAKHYINDSFSKINADLAEKFMLSEYKSLGKEIREFNNLDDQSVVAKINTLSEKVSMFSSRLDAVYSEFIERSEEVESAIKANKTSLKTSANFYFEPIDYFKNKDDATKISVLDYLQEYSDKTDLVNSIKNGIKKAEDLFDEEEFDAAERQTEENVEMIGQANQYAAILQEHMIENFYVAKDMRNVMEKMGFETGAYKIDGHIKNGWKISASNPIGEKIDFTKVYVDDGGKMNIEIDHKTMGDCPSKWSEITTKLEEIGIYIEKIEMENGTVVLDKRKGKPDTSVTGELEMVTTVK